MPEPQQILEALKEVAEPQGGQDIVTLGMVSGLQVADGHVVFMIEVDPAKGAAMESLRQEAEKTVAALSGVKKVTAVLTAERAAGETSQNVANDTYDRSVGGGEGRQNQAAARSSAMDPHGMNKNPALSLPIKKIIAVASGKGGVGKSSVSNALARYLAGNSQLKVGLLDADIYGPSQIILNGLEAKKPEIDDEKMIIPPRVSIPENAYGLKVMSIGFMVDSDKALVWRGPMVQSAIYQLFRDVRWAENDDEPLDVLIVDMPPGTGDAQLTLAQKVPVDGAIIVSTPQDLALADARKGVEMFQKTGVPILGIIENMSTHLCSNCGHEEHIFGHGGAAKEAEKLGVPFLGEIPLSADIRAACDEGRGFDLPEDMITRLNALLD